MSCRVVILQPEGRQFDPSVPHLNAEVPLGKMLNAELPLIEKGAANRSALYECVCEWVSGKLYCKALWVVLKTRKALYKYRPLTICYLTQLYY